MRYHLTQVRMVKIRRWEMTNFGEDVEKGKPSCTVGGNVNWCSQPLWKTVWRFLKELKIELPYDPAIALLGIYPKDTDAVKWQDNLHPNVYSSNVHNSQSGRSLRVHRKMNG